MLSFLFFFESCSSQSNMDPQVVTALVNSQDFSFHAQRANPTNYDVINIANSMPNVPATRIFCPLYFVLFDNNVLSFNAPLISGIGDAEGP